jgi:hypothetical protein
MASTLEDEPEGKQKAGDAAMAAAPRRKERLSVRHFQTFDMFADRLHPSAGVNKSTVVSRGVTRRFNIKTTGLLSSLVTSWGQEASPATQASPATASTEMA